MKNCIILLSLVLISGFYISTVHAQEHLDDPSYPEVTIVPADGSGVSGCEETEDGCYIPSTATVEVGSVVIMSNTDNVAHTFTSGTPDDEPDGIFDTSLLLPGGSFEWAPDTEGTYPYFCVVHPWMIGTILVDEGTMPPAELEPKPLPAVQTKVQIENDNWIPLDEFEKQTFIFDTCNDSFLAIKKSTQEQICIQHSDALIKRNFAIALFDYLIENKDSLQVTDEQLYQAAIIKMRSIEPYKIITEKYPDVMAMNGLNAAGAGYFRMFALNEENQHILSFQAINHVTKGYFTVSVSCENNIVGEPDFWWEKYSSLWEEDYDKAVRVLETTNCFEDEP